MILRVKKGAKKGQKGQKKGQILTLFDVDMISNKQQKPRKMGLLSRFDYVLNNFYIALFQLLTYSRKPL